MQNFPIFQDLNMGIIVAISYELYFSINIIRLCSNADFYSRP